MIINKWKESCIWQEYYIGGLGHFILVTLSFWMRHWYKIGGIGFDRYSDVMKCELLCHALVVWTTTVHWILDWILDNCHVTSSTRKVLVPGFHGFLTSSYLYDYLISYIPIIVPEFIWVVLVIPRILRPLNVHNVGISLSSVNCH